MSGRHRRNFNFRGAGVIGAVMAVVVVASGAWLGYQRFSEEECSGDVPLTVAAAPEIAPVVEQAAADWVAAGAEVNGTCVSVKVDSVYPSTMAAAVAREHQVTLTGLGAAPQAVRVPDAWIPDSTTWLLRLKAEAAGFVPTDGRSVAQSPIVVAMPEPVAESFGWPTKKLGWKDLLTQVTTSNNVKTGIVDPIRDAAGLAGLMALGQAAGADQEGQSAKVSALRALAQSSSAIRDDLLQRFPRSSDAGDLATSLSAAPLSEEDVVGYNAETPPVPLAALYLDPAPAPLDYPFAVMPEVDLQKSAAASGLHDALNGSAFRDALARAGLRSPDGSAGAGFAAPVGAPEASPPASTAPEGGGSAASGLDASALNQALGGWAAITLPGRVLAVFDVSGSMLTPVPTAGNRTRAEVTQAAASQGLSLFDDKWSVGVWIFSTQLRGKQPWREVVPISPLTARRSTLQDSVRQIVPKEGGATGLYDTALAAYQNVLDGWEPGKVNSVILFTDGKNENRDGISRNTLVDRLKKLNDAKRPVRMVIIGIGNEVDRNELEAIAGATSAGGVFIAEDPARISSIFLEAIANRSGAGS